MEVFPVNYTKTALALIIVVAVVLIVLCACGLPVVEVTIAWIGLLATALGVYQWKTKNENRAKYAQKFMDEWAEKYGPDSVAQIMEIVLKD